MSTKNADKHDIAVHWRSRLEVYDWITENQIEAEYQGAKFGRLFGVDLWRIKNERDRVFFLLKWGNSDY